MDENWLKYLQGSSQGFQKYAAGSKRYGTRFAPNIGPTNTPEGYLERDAEGIRSRNALLRRLKALREKRYMSSDALTPGGN